MLLAVAQSQSLHVVLEAYLCKSCFRNAIYQHLWCHLVTLLMSCMTPHCIWKGSNRKEKTKMKNNEHLGKEPCRLLIRSLTERGLLWFHHVLFLFLVLVQSQKSQHLAGDFIDCYVPNIRPCHWSLTCILTLSCDPTFDLVYVSKIKRQKGPNYHFEMVLFLAKKSSR